VLNYVLIAAGLVLYFAQPEGWAKLVGALPAIGSASSKLTDLSGVAGPGSDPRPAPRNQIGRPPRGVANASRSERITS
jgi:hypothetical protein